VSAEAAAARSGDSLLPSPPGIPSYRYLALWALAWAAIGTIVGAGITFARGAYDLYPLLLESVLFAEVVGFTALTSARLVFPLFTKLPFGVRIALQVLTLFSGTVVGSVAVVAAQPLFALARPRTIAVLILLNALFAVIVGIALHTYDSMKRQIELSYRILREKEAIEREVAIAREVQRELLPRALPHIRGLELAAVCVPAIGVGGDLYDFLPYADDRVALVIADVSGKGIPAALLMAGLQASVRSLALPSLGPDEINRRLNDALLRSTSLARYATLFFGHYDARSRVLAYSNAGHYPPLLIGSNGAARLSAGGIPIGLLADAQYLCGQRELKRGEMIALFTDGIIEAPNPDDEEFGEARLTAILQESRNRDLDELVGLVLEDVRAWSAGAAPHDDITLVLARAV
jgi:serine phosphatase RsbU (regulator of sigma subunit)